MVRPVNSHDYPAMAEIWRVLYPHHPRTAEDFRPKNERAAEDFGRLAAEAEGRLVGFGQYQLSRREGEPESKYWLYLTLYPEAERAEVVRALYGGLIDAVGEFGPCAVLTMAQEAMQERLEVLKEAGLRRDAALLRGESGRRRL